MSCVGVYLISPIVTTLFIGALVFLSKNLIIERLKNSVKHEYDVKLTNIEHELNRKSDMELVNLNSRLSAELEILKLKYGPYSERQFAIYNELWQRLIYLKYSMLELWDNATEEALKHFTVELEKATKKLEMAGIIIEDTHYTELMAILNDFAKYEIGKRSLIDYRRHAEPGLRGYEDIRKMIDDNQIIKGRLLDYLPRIKASLQRQIKGESI